MVDDFIPDATHDDFVADQDFAPDVQPQKTAGFWGSVGHDIKNQYQDYQKQIHDPRIMSDALLGGPAQAGLLAAGHTAGGLGEVMFDAAKAVTPDWYQKKGQEAYGPVIDRFGKSGVGQAAMSGLGTMANKYGEFEKEHPALAANLGAVGNIATMGAPIPGIGKSAGNIALEGTGAAAKAGAKGVGLAGRAAGRGIAEGAAGAMGKLLPGIDADTAKLAMKAMDEYDIPLSHQQVSRSPSADAFQKISQEIPFSGTAQFQEKQYKALNKAFARSFGQTAENITPEVMDRAYRQLGAGFDKMFNGQTIHLTPEDISLMKGVLSESKKSIGEDAQKILKENLDTIFKNLDEVNTKPTTTYDPYGPSTVIPSQTTGYTISGEKANQIRTQIQEVLRKQKDMAGEAADPYISDVLDRFMDASFDSLPDASRENYKNLKYKYKNLIAGTPVGAKALRGNINPTLLEGAVRRVYGDTAYARGQAGELGDLAKISKTFLPKLGGSDTITKGGMAAAIGAPLGAFAATGPAGALGTMAVEGAGMGANRLYQGINTNQKAVREFIKKHLPEHVYEDFDGDIPLGEASGGRIGFKLKKPKK